MIDVLVFKTNVFSEERLVEVAPYLNSTKGIVRWNFDLDDIDKVLRIEAADLTPNDIKNTLKYAGFYCEELPG